MSVQLAPATLTLRCHRCSHAVGTSELAMRLVGIFKASLLGRVGCGHQQEIRRRCSHCGWVNIFHPETRRPAIETK